MPVSRYAVPTDLQALSLTAAALTGISADEQQAALDSASGVADGYLASRYTLPITAYGQDLTRAVCNIAAYDLMSVRGYSPDGSNSTIRDRYDDAIRWLERVAAGTVSPVGVVDSSEDSRGDTTGQFVHQARPSDTTDGAFVVGAPIGRGW
jgi:phage gp36-like protein